MSTSRFNIPPDILEQLLPPPDIPIHQFATLELPLLSTQPSPVPDASAFSTMVGLLNTANATILCSQPLPSFEAVSLWRKQAEKLGKGYASFSYPLVQKGKETEVAGLARLPLWTLEYWRQVHRISGPRTWWCLALVWLLNFVNAPSASPIFSQVFNAIKDVRWSAMGDTTNHNDSLARFFGPNWLSDTHVAKLLSLLAPYGDEHTQIVPPLSMLKLVSVFRNQRATYLFGKDTGSLRNMGEKLSESSHGRLAGIAIVMIEKDGLVTLPATNRSGNHWVAFCLDIAKGILHYGDSMGYEQPMELVEVLKWWASEHVDEVDQLAVERMACTAQKDTYSCGILAFNALAHHLYPQDWPLTDPDCCDELRMSLFLKIFEDGCQELHQKATDPERSAPAVASEAKLKKKQVTKQERPGPNLNTTTATVLSNVSPATRRKRSHSEIDKPATQPTGQPPPDPDPTQNALELDTVGLLGSTVDWEAEDWNEERGVEMDPNDLIDAMPAKKKQKRDGGRPPNPLLDKLVIRCCRRGEPSKVFWQCASRCGYTWTKRGVRRVVRHCKDCPRLSPALRKLAAAEAIKSSVSGRLQSFNEPLALPAVKPDNLKTAQTMTVQEGAVQTLALRTGRKERHAKLDQILVNLFCIAGLPTYLISRDEFISLLLVADPSYQIPTREILEYEMIPSEQEYIKHQQIMYLQRHENLTISYDGGTSRGRDAFWTVHVSTKDDEVFFVKGREATAESHTAEWIKQLAMETIDEIGRFRFCGVVSDSTGNTRAARRMIEEECPIIIKLADCCHHLNLLAKDLAKLPYFQSAVSTVRTTVSYFNHSHGATAELRKARQHYKIGRGLEAIGKTRFGTLFITAVSVQRNIPAITRVSTILGEDFEKLQPYYQPLDSPTPDSFSYQFELAALVKAGLPTTKAIACTEGEEVNAGDVYLLFHAIFYETMRGLKLSKVPDAVIEQVIGCLNKRYTQLFKSGPNASSVYVAAAFLNPALLQSDLFKRERDHRKDRKHALTGVDNPKVYDEVLIFLISIGKQEIRHGGKPVLTKWKGKAAPFADRLRVELLAYARGQYPYNNPLDKDLDRACLRWWEGLAKNKDAQILPHLAIKIYALRVNSMAEERTVSRFTWITPPLRNRLSVSSMVAMTQIGQYARTLKDGKTPRKATERMPVGEVRFSTVRKRLFPLADVDEVPSSVRDPELDDGWLDEPAEDILPDITPTTDDGPVNLESSIIRALLADHSDVPTDGNNKADTKGSSGDVAKDDGVDDDDDNFSDLDLS